MQKKHPQLRRRTFFTPLLMPMLGGLFLLAVLSWLYVNMTTTTVILVRHAEKVADAGSDPGLTAAGRERARALARMFKDAGIDALYASEYQRTQLTLKPLSEALGVDIGVVSASEPATLVEEIFSTHRGGTVIIAGHSNTLPELIQLLSDKEAAPIDESDYGGIYILSLPRFGEERLSKLNFPD